jgi:ABC-type sugar transport system substrate-binding protein
MTNRRNHGQRTSWLALGVILALAAAGCSSSSSNSDPSNGANTLGSSGSLTSDASAAAARIAPILGENTNLGPDTPLTRRPPAGKTVAELEGNIETLQAVTPLLRAATDALHWHLKVISYTYGDPVSANSAMLQAIQQHPDYIVAPGLGMDTLASGVKAAKAAGIPVYFTASESRPDRAAGVYAISQDLDYTERSYSALLDYAISTAKPKANILVVAYTDATIISATLPTLRSHMKQACPECGYKELDVTTSDLEQGSIPGLVVSALQQDPSITSIFFPFEQLYLGVPQALAAAGMSGKQILLTSPQETGLKDFAAGKIAAVVPYPLGTTTWAIVDAMARDSIGMPYDTATYAVQPFGIWTQDNHPNPVPSSYYGPPGWQETYMKLWHVAG